MNDKAVSITNADVVDRLARVRAVLPLIAADLAVARRRSATLETENRRLRRRVIELESTLAAAGDPPADRTAPLRRHLVGSALAE